jgi:putative membrane protein
MKNCFKNFVKGMLIGASNIMPGVSGGTIAVILNIFDDLIYAINNFTKSIKSNLKFLLPIILGACFTILVFSSVIEICMRDYSLQTNLFFIGLICGSIPLIYNKTIAFGNKKFHLLPAILSASLIVVLSNMSNSINANTTSQVSILFWIKILLGGILASSAMIIPGISGSFIMILLGIYQTVIHALVSLHKDIFSMINNGSNKTFFFSLKILILLGAGIIIGIILTSKLISYLFKKFYSESYSFILGLVIASVYSIFSSPTTYCSSINNVSILISIFSFLIGATVSYFLGDDKATA